MMPICPCQSILALFCGSVNDDDDDDMMLIIITPWP
jgi:hypothetical protein